MVFIRRLLCHSLGLFGTSVFLLGLVGLLSSFLINSLAITVGWILYLLLFSIHYFIVVENTMQRRHVTYERLYVKGERVRATHWEKDVNLHRVTVVLKSSFYLSVLYPFSSFIGEPTSAYTAIDNVINPILLYLETSPIQLNAMTVRNALLLHYFILWTCVETYVILFREYHVVGKIQQLLTVWACSTIAFVMFLWMGDVITLIGNSANQLIEPTWVGESFQLYFDRGFKFASVSDHIFWNAIRGVDGVDYKDFVVNGTFSQNLYNSQMAEAEKTSEGARFVLAILHASEKQTRKMELNPGLEAQLHATIKSCQDIQEHVDYWGT